MLSTVKFGDPKLLNSDSKLRLYHDVSHASYGILKAVLLSPRKRWFLEFHVGKVDQKPLKALTWEALGLLRVKRSDRVTGKRKK